MTIIEDPEQPLETPPDIVRACEAAETRLGPLVAIVAPLARTRPDAPAPADLLVLARQALRPAQRVGMWLRLLPLLPLLPLHEPVSYAGLAARLALARSLLVDFRRRYREYDPATGTVCWQVRDWLILAARERDAALTAAGTDGAD